MLIKVTDPHLQYQCQSRHPLDLLLQAQPRKYHPNQANLSPKPPACELPYALPWPPRLLLDWAVEFCEGYNSEEITHCSNLTDVLVQSSRDTTQRASSWCNHCSPFRSHIILDLIRITSHIIFGGFLTGICMNTVSIFATPLAIFPDGGVYQSPSRHSFPPSSQC